MFERSLIENSVLNVFNNMKSFLKTHFLQHPSSEAVLVYRKLLSILFTKVNDIGNENIKN